MARLNRDGISEVKDLEIVDFEVPEWNYKVVGLRSLSGFDRQRIQDKRDSVEEDPIGFLCFLVALSVVDDTGKQVFNPDNKDDIELLKGKHGAAIGSIADQIRKLNKIGTQFVEEASKNLQTDQGSSSGSDLPNDSDTPSLSSNTESVV